MKKGCGRQLKHKVKKAWQWFGNCKKYKSKEGKLKEFSCAEPTERNGAELQKQLKGKKVKSCAEKNK